MPLSEGVSARIAYAAYATGDITANELDDPTTAPGPTGGQILRRVSSTLSLAKNTYQSAEIRNDRQIVDFRHGVQRAEGNIAGEISLGTYMDFFEAVHRDTRTAGATADQTTLTSIAASKSASTITFGGGDPVAAGFGVGSVIRVTGSGSVVDNTNFTVLGFSGTTNRVVAVTPAPTADVTVPVTTFTAAAPGATTMVPSSNFVKRKFGVEVFHEDLNIARLYRECRIGSYHLALPATGMGTVEFNVLGRAQFDPATGPYFTDPAAETNTPVLTAVNGSLYFGTEKVGVATSADMTMNLTPTPAEVIGQNFSAEIFLGRANLTGTITAFLDSQDLIDDFINEAEVSFLLTMTSSSAANSPAMSIFMPRLKFSTAAINLTGEGGQSVSFGFQALKYVGSAAGMPQTTIVISDTEAPASLGRSTLVAPAGVDLGSGAAMPSRASRMAMAAE